MRGRTDEQLDRLNVLGDGVLGVAALLPVDGVLLLLLQVLDRDHLISAVLLVLHGVSRNIAKEMREKRRKGGQWKGAERVKGRAMEGRGEEGARTGKGERPG